MLILDALSSIGAYPSYNFLQEKHGCSHTFHVKSTNASSLIDFFFIFTSLDKTAESFEILHLPSNFSDHLPIKILFPLKSVNGCVRPTHNPPISIAGPNITKINIKWDSNNKMAYYENTRRVFFELHNILANVTPAQLAELRPDIVSSKGANTIYNNLIHGLLNCSLLCFERSNNGNPVKRKWWGDDSIRAAKTRSLSAFKLWVAEGRVADSLSHYSYLNAKKDYRIAVRDKKLLPNIL